MADTKRFIKCTEQSNHPLSRTVYVNADTIAAITEDLFGPHHKEGCIIRVVGVKEDYFFMDTADYLMDKLANKFEYVITARNTKQP